MTLYPPFTLQQIEGKLNVTAYTEPEPENKNKYCGHIKKSIETANWQETKVTYPVHADSVYTFYDEIGLLIAKRDQRFTTEKTVSEMLDIGIDIDSLADRIEVVIEHPEDDDYVVLKPSQQNVEGGSDELLKAHTLFCENFKERDSVSFMNFLRRNFLITRKYK